VDDLAGQERVFASGRVGARRVPQAETHADARDARCEGIGLLVHRLRDQRAKLVFRQVSRGQKSSLFVEGRARAE
jgi:hypothetical protein